MDDIQFISNLNAARDLMEDEANRTRANFQPNTATAAEPQQTQQQQPNIQHPHQQQRMPTTTPFIFQQPQPARQPYTQLPPVQPTTQQQQPPQMPTSLFGPDPAFSGPQLQPQPNQISDAQHIRQMVPFLAHLTDSYLLAQPIDALYRLNREEKQAEAAKTTKGLEIKLYQNFKNAADNPIFMDGYDNRSSYLHPARFLPGAGVTLQQQWLEARKLWGQDGKDAIANYDLESLGCSGCVTARGWEILHKPGSPELSLKLFSISNVGHSSTGSRTVSLAGEDGITIHESWKELTDMVELKRALRNLILAARLSMPWNFSFEVLHGFLQAKGFMEEELNGVKKATILSGFIDHVFKVNAGLWVQEAPFLDATKLQVLWDSWWCTRKNGAKADPDTSAPTQQSNHGSGGGGNNNHKKKNNKSFKNNHKGWSGPGGQHNGGNRFGGHHGNGGGTPPVPNHSGPPSEMNVCRRFNDGNCQNHFSNCVISTQKGPLRLYHLCNYMCKKNGNSKMEMCLNRHARVDHK